MPTVACSDLEPLATGLDHVEGIALAPDGYLYAGGEAGQLYRISIDGTVMEIASLGGICLGIAADAASRIYVCDQTHSVVWRWDPMTGQTEVFSNGDGSRALRTPNWGAFDRLGNYYLTDSGDWKQRNGCIWRVEPGGGTRLWNDTCVDFPNGCALSIDGSRLYVVESTPGRIVAIPIRRDGSAGSRSLVADLPGSVPDGIAVAADGSLLITCYRPDRIYHWSSTSGITVFAEDPDGAILACPTNLTFAGASLEYWIVANLGARHLTKGSGLVGAALSFPSRELLRS